MALKKLVIRAFQPLGLLASLCVSANALANFEVLHDFGDNPGDLTASVFSPTQASDALVVLLHGCVQQGEQLAEQSGFYSLAKAENFHLLIPQQHSKNNIKDCFNWFSSQDTKRDSGELKSIINMINEASKSMTKPRVFVVGLSAGGAMAATLLSQYPNKFKGGAIIAGLPFPCADTLTKAISCMRNGPSQTPDELAQMISKLQVDSTVSWPSLSIWTGNNDQVVNPINSQYLAKQWLLLTEHTSDGVVQKGDGFKRTLWGQPGETRIELVELTDLGHGLGVNPVQQHGGEVGAFLLKSPLASAKEITNFWGLMGKK